MWCLTGNLSARDSSPGGGGIFFPFFGLLVVSLRLGYLKAVSTSCWKTISTLEVYSSHVFSSLTHSVMLKNSFNNNI